jgi:hypothetical protein
MPGPEYGRRYHQQRAPGVAELSTDPPQQPQSILALRSTHYASEARPQPMHGRGNQQQLIHVETTSDNTTRFIPMPVRMYRVLYDHIDAREDARLASRPSAAAAAAASADPPLQSVSRRRPAHCLTTQPCTGTRRRLGVATGRRRTVIVVLVPSPSPSPIRRRRRRRQRWRGGPPLWLVRAGVELRHHREQVADEHRPPRGGGGAAHAAASASY